MLIISSLLQIVSMKDIIRPPKRENFNDVYIIYELLDTDLHQIIRSNQSLNDDHCRVCLQKLLLEQFYFNCILVENFFELLLSFVSFQLISSLA